MVLQRLMEQLLDRVTSCCRGLGPPPPPPMCVLLYTSAIHMLIAACSGFLAYEATRRNVRVKLSDCAFTGMETLRTCFLEARPQP